jgi:hypothetical protein
MLQAGRSWVPFRKMSLYFLIDVIPSSLIMALGITRSTTEMSTRIFPGELRANHFTRLYRKCAINDISRPYRPPGPVTDITLLFTVLQLLHSNGS